MYRKVAPLSSVRHQACLAAFAGLLCAMLSLTTPAQILQGQWVDSSEAAIAQHRKTDVAVIVLDRQDRAIQGAKVHLAQQRHDFVLGLTLPDTRMPPKQIQAKPVLRCFNAIALDRYTDWSTPPQEPIDVNARRLAAWQEALQPIHTRFGTVISADPARNHDRLSLLGPDDLRDAVMARIDLAAVFDPRPDRYDLYADLLQQDMIERKLGHGMIHRMFERAKYHQPNAQFALRVRNAISLQNGRELAAMVQKMEVRQLPFDRVTIEQHFRGTLQPNALKRMLDQYVATLPKPVTIASLQIGGPSQVAAGLNMEMFLRLAFAQPRIDGIYLHGLYADELIESHAALLDEQNKPTPAGQVLDQLFQNHWRTDLTAVTDERGNAQARVFTGWYTVTANLPDGSTISNQAYIPKSERTKLIILQTTAAEQN